MSTATADYSISKVIHAPETSGIGVDFVGRPQQLNVRFSFPLREISNLFFALATLTSTGINLDPSADLRRSIATPGISWSVQQRRGRRISLREARKIALRILEETEREFQEERSAEATFLLMAWDESVVEN